MKLVLVSTLLSLSAAVSTYAFTETARANQVKEQGGELGNAFIPFASKIGHYSLEYSKDWRLNDLSVATSFADPNHTGPFALASPSFFTVEVNTEAPQSLADLLALLKSLRPNLAWAPYTLNGMNGYVGVERGVRQIYLLRAPGDEITIRLFSADGERSDDILSHMLASFRAE